jgi:hypothetical protein
LQADQLLRERSHTIGVSAAPPQVHPHVAGVGPTQARKRLRERSDASLREGIVFVEQHEDADPPHAVALLRDMAGTAHLSILSRMEPHS